MRKAIIIHGSPEEKEYLDPSKPSPSNNHWFPWIQKQLLKKGILAQTPEMPVPYDPKYEDWKEVFERFDINEETILIGHSCGGGFLIRWLSENDVRVRRVVLVAPWLDPEHENDINFFKFEIDPNLASKTQGVTIMYSTDDFSAILTTVKILKSKLVGAEFQEFSDKGHFVLGDMKTQEFPELLENII